MLHPIAQNDQSICLKNIMQRIHQTDGNIKLICCVGNNFWNCETFTPLPAERSALKRQRYSTGNHAILNIAEHGYIGA